MGEVKVLIKISKDHVEDVIQSLMMSGLWASMHPDERERIKSRGEILDTSCGRSLLGFMSRCPSCGK